MYSRLPRGFFTSSSVERSAAELRVGAFVSDRRLLPLLWGFCSRGTVAGGGGGTTLNGGGVFPAISPLWATVLARIFDVTRSKSSWDALAASSTLSASRSRESDCSLCRR